MNEKEKLTENVSTRITKTQKAKLDELDVTLREVIDYYIIHKTNRTLELNNRKKELVKSINAHEEALESERKELTEINVELGVPLDNAEVDLVVFETAEKIKNNCIIKYGLNYTITDLGNYLNTNQAANIFNYSIVQYKIENPVKFKEQVLKFLENELK